MMLSFMSKKEILEVPFGLSWMTLSTRRVINGKPKEGQKETRKRDKGRGKALN